MFCSHYESLREHGLWWYKTERVPVTLNFQILQIGVISSHVAVQNVPEETYFSTAPGRNYRFPTTAHGRAGLSAVVSSEDTFQGAEKRPLQL